MWTFKEAGKSSSGNGRGRRGGALIAALFLVIISLLLATGYVDTLTAENKTAKENEIGALALYAADAGIQYALEAIRNNPGTSPNGFEAVLFATPGNLSVRFRVEEILPNPGCPGGGQIDGLACRGYRVIGTVINPAISDPVRQIVSRKLVDAVLTIGAEGNVITWNEHFI